MIQFSVFGKPEPGGSKKGFPVKRQTGGIGVAIVDANPRVKAWQKTVRAAAEKAMKREGQEIMTGPLQVCMVFWLTKPKTVTRELPTARPDVLKLARAAEDALTGVVWKDDAQITEEAIEKKYGDPAGVLIQVTEL